MKKTIILFFVHLVIAPFIFSQSKADAEKLITGKTWGIAEDTQSGIGEHKSLEEGTTLVFKEDGTWTCSGLIEGENNGKWSLKNNKQLLIIPGKEGKQLKFEILVLNENTLRYKYKKFSTVRTLEWRAK